jgi:2,3-diketo-5-methylthio-1-phosphopentane phosphatase
MKPYIFVTDFDGTLTKKDFYKILIDRYLPELGKRLYTEWKQNKIKDVDFLGEIFKSANRSENEFFEDIKSIEMDDYFEKFVCEIKNSGGDFLILSAGTSYYIEKLFEYKGIKNIKIISNKGKYENRGIHLLVDKESEFYSEVYGINKASVIKYLKQQYSKVYFAGDSGPDVEASKLADIPFATGKLKGMLNSQNISYIPFSNFKEISNYLKKIEVFL